jgi:hypothetical protein
VVGVEVVGEREGSSVSLSSDHIDIFALSAALKAKGWPLRNSAPPPAPGLPPSRRVTLCLSYCESEEGVAEGFLEDLKGEVASLLKRNPGPKAGRELEKKDVK